MAKSVTSVALYCCDSYYFDSGVHGFGINRVDLGDVCDYFHHCVGGYCVVTDASRGRLYRDDFWIVCESASWSSNGSLDRIRNALMAGFG